MITSSAPSLQECLAELRNAELSLKVRMLDPKLRLTNKLQLTRAITAALISPRLKDLWEALPTTAKIAVAEALHSPQLRLDLQRFIAKHEVVPVFTVSSDPRRTVSYRDDPPTLLGLFLYPLPGGGQYGLPGDMADILRTFVPKPPEVAIRCLSQPPRRADDLLRETESEALSEVLLLLRLADTGGLAHGASTGLPSTVAIQAMLKLIPLGDWFSPESVFEKPAYPGGSVIGAIKMTGWTRLLLTAGLITMRGGRSALTEHGRRVVKQPPWEIVRRLWCRWLANTEFDEFNRVDLIKGQTSPGVLTARQPRRLAVAHALESCPAGQWITVREFSRHLRAEGAQLEITQSPDSLYIHDRRYGCLGYNGGHGWDILQDRYIACLLMEYAAPLGLVDLCYVHPAAANAPLPEWVDVEWISRYDGLTAFRITPLGAWCLKPDSCPFVPSQPPLECRLKVLPNLTIQAESGVPSPAERIQIESWAEPVGENTWRADPDRALASVEAGRDPAEFGAYLRERDEQPLPETMEAFLRKVAADGRALCIGPTARLIQCRDAATTAMLAAGLEGLCLRAGETTLAVPENKLGTFRKRVRSFGLGIQ